MLGLMRRDPPVIPPTASSTFIVAEGDSITQNLATLSTVTYPILYAPDASLVKLINNGHAGDRLAGPVSREASNIALIAANPGYTNYYYTILIGVNETGNATYYPSGAAQLATDIGTHVAVMKAGGFTKVIVTTLPDTHSETLVTSQWLDTLNTGIRALVPSQADAYIDHAAGPMGFHGASLDLAKFFDGLHPIPRGQILMEIEYATALNSLIAGAVVPGDLSAVSASSIKTTSLLLSWEAPAGGGYYTDCVVGYRITGSGSSWTTVSHARNRGLSCFVTGLTANTSYDFRVAATGPSGQSANYAICSATTLASLPNTLDTITATPFLAFSNGNMSALARPEGSTSLNVRTMIGKATGKWYFEFLLNGAATIGPFAIGLCDDTYLQAMSLGQNAGEFPNSAVGGEGPSIVNGFTAVNTINLSSWADGDRLKIAFDAGAGKAWLGKNGVWGASGDPVAGTNPWVTWTPGMTIYGCATLNYVNVTITYSGASPFLTVPTGYSALA